MVVHAPKQVGATPWLLAAAFAALTCTAAAPLRAQDQPAVETSFATALIRDVLIAVNQANWTGNYTVLRDYAAPSFHEENDATRLAAIMQTVRAERIDLLPVTAVDPVILSSDVSPDRSLIRLIGYFPLEPRHVSFDLQFEQIGTRWLVYGLSVGAFDPSQVPEFEASLQ